MKIINVTRSSMPSLEEYVEEIKPLFESHWLTNMGEKHQKLENKLKEYLNCEYINLYTNGHLALEGILEGFDFPKGSEIITTPFTFSSTTHAIVRTGYTPIFCDINSDDYTIDTAKIEELITDKTVAIMSVHVYGNMCDVEKIDYIAKKHNLKVIYDAAHAFGVKFKGTSSANFGDMTMFSFHATKVFNTIEGGAVISHDECLHKKLNEIKNFGITGPESVVYVGGNAKMNEFQAAMGICNLRHLTLEISKRKKVVERYRENLKNIPGIKLVKCNTNVDENYAYFPVVFDGYKYNRDEVYAILEKNNIFSRKYFFPITNSLDCYKELPSADVTKTPNAKYIGDRILTLPLYADLGLDDVDKICYLIKK